MMECRQVQRLIWSGEADDALAPHLEGCDDCRAEALRAAEVRGALSGLRYLPAAVPAELETAILAGLERSWGIKARRVVSANPRLWRGLGVGAAAAAAAAATVGVVVARRRLRPDLAA